MTFIEFSKYSFYVLFWLLLLMVLLPTFVNLIVSAFLNAKHEARFKFLLLLNKGEKNAKKDN